MVRAEDLTGWCPVRLFPDGSGQLRVDWRYLGALRFSRRSFFDNVVDTALREPFAAALWRETPVSALIDWAGRAPGVPLRGLIHHMSRCGSTLVAGMLGACPSNISLSEPSPLDTILRFPMAREDRVTLARAWVSACAQARFGERAAFIKHDCWHAREIPFLREAFRGIPWVFLYREPLEVIVSHVDEPSPWTVQGLMDLGLLDMPLAEATALSREDHVGRALGVVLEWALREADDPLGLLVEYSELPGAFVRRILPHFGVEYSAEEIAMMEAAAQLNAKAPQLAFEPDVERKRKAVKPWMREIAARWIDPHYRALEEMRKAGEYGADGAS